MPDHPVAAPAQSTEKEVSQKDPSEIPSYRPPDNAVDKALLEVQAREYYRGAFEYQERRHGEWLENYMLTRMRVITNRVTQRQTAVLPLAKETLKTILANVDDNPDIKFEDYGNDEQIEIYCNAAWEEFAKRNKLEIKDVMDKRCEMTYGRGVMKLNLENGEDTLHVLDPADLLVDRYTDPADIDKARYVCHRNIFRKLSELWQNKNYDKEVLEKLSDWTKQGSGLIKIAENLGRVADQAIKLEYLGDTDAMQPVLGETYLELREHYLKITDEDVVKKAGKQKEGFVWYVLVQAESQTLVCEPLEELIGINELTIVTWADDVEVTDFWSDGVIDVVRNPNKILNTWYSQMVENRTLRNFGMNYYDKSKDETFRPDSLTPQPWGWIGLPTKPSEFVMRVDVPDISGSLEEMNYVTQAAEKASAATATEKGQQAKGDVTLGEIQITTAKAMNRINSIAKYYRIARQQLAEKWYKIKAANYKSMKSITLYKKGMSGEFYEVTISPSQMISKKGFKVTVTSSAEQEQKTVETLQKAQAVKAQMPNNKALAKIASARSLDLLDLTPDEKKEILEEEEKSLQLAGQVVGSTIESVVPPPQQQIAQNIAKPIPSPAAV